MLKKMTGKMCDKRKMPFIIILYTMTRNKTS